MSEHIRGYGAEHRTEDAYETYDTTEIVQPLIELSQTGQSRYRIFSDWVTIILASLEGDEATYSNCVDSYSADEVKLFSEAFAQLVLKMEQFQVDVLGDVYESFGVNSDSFGQHFTPHSVSDMMAAMRVQGESEESDSPVRIADPACGSGRLLISMSRLVSDGEYYGYDKSRVCAMMAVINLALFNLTGGVVNGDSLALTEYDSWVVAEGEVYGLG